MSYSKKDEEEIKNIARANKLEWERDVESNDALILDLTELRSKHKVPSTQAELVDLIDSNILWFQNLQNEFDEIINLHQVKQKWRKFLWGYILDGRLSGGFYLGLPGFRIEFKDTGEEEIKINVTDETPIHNPIVQDYIKGTQRIRLKPPRPIPDKKKPNKLDWNPVWEWSKKHPNVSIKELAKMMGYSYGYVRQKLSLLDKENS